MGKTFRLVSLLVLFSLVLSVTSFPYCSAANQQPSKTKQSQSSSRPDRGGSSTVFPIRGNVHPIGYYYAIVYIGNPPKPYFLDIDTGSDLTWLQCDAPCVSCSKVPHPYYRPVEKNLVPCIEPICASLHPPGKHRCENPNDQCDYVVDYADEASSLGVLVRDVFPLHCTNGSLLKVQLAFGCGYDQQVAEETVAPTDGVLGLGRKSNFVSQLSNGGLIRNVVGHCFSVRGGGYLFFGDDLIPSSGVVWAPMSSGPSDKHYSPGYAELFIGKQSSGVKGLHIIFDSGSTFTYFNSQAYHALLSSVKKDLSGTPLKVTDDKNLPICWKGTKSFKSIQDVKKYFKPITLVFSSGNKPQLSILPEAYLIITSYGNVCLGVLNGGEVGLRDWNIIGDISFQDRLVIYDNERQQIGWVPKDCSRLPKSGSVL